MKLWTLFATLLINLTLFFTACSSDDKNAGGTSEAENSIAITDKTVAGVSQKGPFTNGSVVTLYELNFRTRAQTGKSFFGKISDDKGSFSINNIELASQYALLRADGFYRNEITGKVSTSQITLNAISDLSERDNVNINLLTHLEYERAIWLAQENEISISEAKVEADKEIFAAFGAEYDGNHFEDLNIFGSGDADAALLAISVIMHAGRSEGEFSLALANLAMDLQKDGQWNDSTAITDAADNSFDADTVQIRRNMEEWNIANLIPDFAPIVEYFWNDVFGLGRCTAKREGEIRANSNSRSRYFDYDFVCENGHWHLFGEMETSSSAGKSYSSSSEGDDSSSSEALSSSSETSPNAVQLLADIEPDSWFNPNVTYGTLKDDRDGNTYKTVTIGTQNWMAENLKFNGTNADEVTLNNLKDNIECYYPNESYCQKAGYMYSWTAAMNISPAYQYDVSAYPGDINHQGICPEGWHIPAWNEWETLFNYAYENGKAYTDSVGTMLKSTETWEYDPGAPLGKDLFGFSIVSTGALYGWNGFSDKEGQNAAFWTADAIEGYDRAIGINFYHWMAGYDMGGRGKSWITGYIRCVENAQ